MNRIDDEISNCKPKLSTHRPFQIKNRLQVPFIQIPHEVFSMGLDVYEFRLFLQMYFVSYKSGLCFARQDTLADQTQMSVRKLRTTLHSLVIKGLVAKLPTPAHKPCEYEITAVAEWRIKPPEPEKVDAATRHQMPNHDRHQMPNQDLIRHVVPPHSAPDAEPAVSIEKEDQLKRRSINTTQSCRQAKNRTDGIQLWDHWKAVYEFTHEGVQPIRNAQINGMLARLVKMVGLEPAKKAMTAYVNSKSAPYYQAQHPLSLLIRDIQKFIVESTTGNKITKSVASGMQRREDLDAVLEKSKRMVEGTDPDGKWLQVLFGNQTTAKLEGTK